jgi:hypothetical protein
VRRKSRRGCGSESRRGWARPQVLGPRRLRQPAVPVRGEHAHGHMHTHTRTHTQTQTNKHTQQCALYCCAGFRAHADSAADAQVRRQHGLIRRALREEC